MKINKVVFFLILLGSTKLIAQDKFAVYCQNDSLTLRGLKVFSLDYSIGYSQDLRTVYLLNAEQLIVDKIDLEAGETVQSINLVEKDLISVDALNSALLISINDASLVVKERKVLNFNKIPLMSSVIFEENKLVGWKRDKKEKNFYTYNKGVLTQVTKKLPSRSKYNGSNQIISNYYFDNLRGLIYIPLEEKSAVCIYNIQTEESEYYFFPENNSRNESWYYYFDSINDKHFAILFKKNNRNILYEIADKFGELKYLKEIDFTPVGIVGNNFHVIDKNKDDLNCHFLLKI
jgi:hypothetical protein